MIAVKNVGKAYGANTVFADVSFMVEDQKGMFLTGASGCGKTTLLRLIAGFDLDYTGEIRIDGRTMTEKIQPRERDVAVVFQEPTLWNHMTIRKNLMYGMKQKDDEAVQKIAEKLEIAELLDRYPEEISGGQAKRVSLARALLADKKYLLLDEPLSNVDRKTKDIILDYLSEEVIGKKSVIYVTHDAEERNRMKLDVLEL
ncbi:MAG: ABC transporter ATP-binding protein [Lachnospiraceae bacterium]|nr:ABC transporter ATP-binding protein [Lachnospiraceae bacterium]